MHFLSFSAELDSELLDDKSTVTGVLTADEKGLCLMGKWCNFQKLDLSYFGLSCCNKNHPDISHHSDYKFIEPLSAEGDIDRNISRLAVSLANAAEELEPNSGETPTIVLDSLNTCV